MWHLFEIQYLIPGDQYPYLHGLLLAHPVGSDNKFEITLLIGADFYWNIIYGKGPTAVESKIGCLLSGPLSPQHSEADIDVFYTAVMQFDNTRFWNVEQVGASLTTQSNEISADQIKHFIASSAHRESDGSYTVGKLIILHCLQTTVFLKEGMISCTLTSSDVSSFEDV